MAPCGSRTYPESRRDSGEAQAPVGQPRDAASQRQNGEAMAPNRGQLRGNSGRVQVTDPYRQHLAVEAQELTTAEGTRHAA